MSYENSHKNYGTKPVPIERVLNPEHFDMHLVTKHLMVPEILAPKSLCFLYKKIGKAIGTIEP